MQRARFGAFALLLSGELAHEPDDEAGAGDGDDDAADADGLGVDAEEAGDQAADGGADDAEQDAQPEAVVGLHDKAGQPADERADQNGDDDVPEHVVFLLCVFMLRALPGGRGTAQSNPAAGRTDGCARRCGGG